MHISNKQVFQVFSKDFSIFEYVQLNCKICMVTKSPYFALSFKLSLIISFYRLTNIQMDDKLKKYNFWTYNSWSSLFWIILRRLQAIFLSLLIKKWRKKKCIKSEMNVSFIIIVFFTLMSSFNCHRNRIIVVEWYNMATLINLLPRQF